MAEKDQKPPVDSPASPEPPKAPGAPAKEMLGIYEVPEKGKYVTRHYPMRNPKTGQVFDTARPQEPDAYDAWLAAQIAAGWIYKVG